ncbi:LysR family transcriptional regulator [Vreelandella venusta]|uniref:LysR family transcriptional regulator n=1 Tax=Vreelandella venusta TaxID=44935 RepID=A0AAQ0CGS2_9GAMM|nr:LysR family transcriptional regulator [Halomonas venusta]MDW0360380.1 LysR family transcriptional regulator [Halomonas venusta]MDX1354856.1 LysR family transcriptional regulator [Halomonas venusta]QRL02347.1 LysR family transcriptional regulator [Halomonas venusta]UQI39626.1 LysR family transcriptional regulator [Halomonas venusta]WAM47687.1 LysR family transcriptional regulator [Halomonas venusta]
MNEQQIRWDDLQIVLAIAETGSLSGASRALRISHATVFRRLNEMERRLKVTLFERSRTGYIPTLSGDDLAASARRVQSEVNGAERRIIGQDLTLSGSLRITTTDTLFAGLLSPLLASFRQRYPDITLEVVISNQRQSLSRREADIAIRPTRQPPETLVGRKLSDISLAIYGQKALWQNAPLLLNTPLPLDPVSLQQEAWIGPDVQLGDTALEKWMMDKRAAYKLDSMLGMQSAVRHGAGIAVLPCYLADADEALLKLSAPIEALTTPLWLLTHPDLRHVARVRAFMQAIAEGVGQQSA